MSYFSNTAGTTCTSDTSLTLTSITEMLKVIERLPPEPFGEWMRSQGCPPEDWTVVLPKQIQSECPYWPKYVRFSAYVDSPTFIRGKSFLL